MATAENDVKLNFLTREEKGKEAQYLTSPTGLKVLNYKVYNMNFLEIILYALIAFAVGAFVGYLFFGNLAMDEYGRATDTTRFLNILIPSIFGAVAAIIFIPVRRKQLKVKRQRTLARQFRDLLEGLTTSISAGSNVNQAFSSVYQDLQVQYDKEDFIVKEVEVILIGLQNNFAIEDLIRDMGQRSANPDILSFANVFAVSYRKGGNLASVMDTTHEVLSSKMQISEEIQTTIAASKNSLYVMLVMPILLTFIMKGMGEDMNAMFTTPIGIGATAVALVMFVIAYVVGNQILDIKV